MSGAKRYWLTVKVNLGSPKITHDEPMWLKAYFDENPRACDINESTEGHTNSNKRDNFVYPAEKTSHQTINRFVPSIIDFELTESEYNSKEFNIFFWIEPYGYAAIRGPKYSVGRGVVTQDQLWSEERVRAIAIKGGLAFPPRNSQPIDEQIVCEIELTQSVINFIADEINVNSTSSIVKRMSDLNSGSDIERFNANTLRFISSRQDAENLLLHKFHNNSNTIQGWSQWVAFGGGGEWDHKPIIEPIWGAINRLGNRGYAYFYDIWSNIHYGYIGAKAGFRSEYLVDGAARAQFFDNPGTSQDDGADVAAVREGIALASKSHVTMQDLINVVRRHPEWDFAERFPNA